jgi:NAD(P)-dependent dehydrogenase (short-subunit alcohol dehydrogenase family)
VSGTPDLRGKRVLITGAARGIGALTARRLHERGARVALLGLEPELLEAVAASCGDAPWRNCDVSDRGQVDASVEHAVAELGGLDIFVANAGVAAQLSLAGGDARVFEQTHAVNVLGTYYLIRAAAPHISHRDGYALLTASLAATVHLPLLGAYASSKAAVVALGNSLRAELAPSGAKVGIAYFTELDTDMTARGFATRAAARTPLGGHGLKKVAPVGPAINAIERGIRRRSRRVVSPPWVAAVLPLSGLVMRAVPLVMGRGLAETLEIARAEDAALTTEQPAATAPAATIARDERA